MTTYPDHILRMGSQQLAEMKRKAAEFERQLWDAHSTLESELAQSALAPEGDAWAEHEAVLWSPGATEPGIDDGALPVGPVRGHPPTGGWHPEAEPPPPTGRWHPEAEPPPPAGRWHPEAEPAPATYTPEDRTSELVNRGRPGAKRGHRFGGLALAAIATAVIAALITVLVVRMSRPAPGWPASVAQVQREIAVACQNPDVASEPSQVNFACGKGTRQILWVFSLLTSGDNPDYASIRTGRQGLEPITPAQGGEVAWSLNLHHPYNPGDPIDSLEVAARAINNIIGGATLTAANGKPVVQSGLESISANCARYTGSGALTARRGFPDRCTKPISSSAGQGNLVADVFQKWVVGARPASAEDAAVLFQNARNPGDPRVRAILRSVRSSKLAG